MIKGFLKINLTCFFFYLAAYLTSAALMVLSAAYYSFIVEGMGLYTWERVGLFWIGLAFAVNLPLAFRHFAPLKLSRANFLLYSFGTSGVLANAWFWASVLPGLGVFSLCSSLVS